MIKSIPDPQRIHSITCPACLNSFITTHLKQEPRFCVICGSSLKKEVDLSFETDHEASIVTGPIPDEREVKFSVDTYKVLNSIGRGGMGEVFLAYDTTCGRKIALKKIRDDLKDHPVIQNRFLKEARITSQLTHPAIIPIYGIHKETEIYYTMPYVEGETLKQILRKAKGDEKKQEKSEDTSIGALTPIFLTICQAIAYAHSKKIIHRDLKPENIIVGKFGEVLLLDWGLAKLSQSHEQTLPETEETEALTHLGKIVGTIAYMPPERTLGIEADEQSDIYALGVILYQILTLKMPFKRKSYKEFKQNAYKEGFLEPVEAAPYREVPFILSRILKKCLDTNRDKRYKTVSLLIHDLENYLEGRAEFFPIEELDIHNKSHWEFQENVLFHEQIAITRGVELVDWVNLMISSKSFSENLKMEIHFTLREGSKGLGFLLSIPQTSERSYLTEGLLLWLGTKNGEATHLSRSHVEVLSDAALILPFHEKISLVIEQIDKSLHVWINGELEISYAGQIPLLGSHVGFLSRDFDFTIEKWTVYESSHNIFINCLAVPDAFLAEKNYSKALSEYRRIATSFPGRYEGREGAFRAGITMLEEGREKSQHNLYDLANEEFGKLRNTSGAPLEYLGKAFVYHALNDFDEEIKCYELCLRRYPNHPLLSVIQEHILFRLQESLNADRRQAYHFLLLILQYLPKLSSSHAVKRILENVMKHAEPVYFFYSKPEWKENRSFIGLFLAFWLAKTNTLLEIGEAEDDPGIILNAVYALKELGNEPLANQLLETKKLKIKDEERKTIFNLSKMLIQKEYSAIIDELSYTPLSVPLNCLKIEAYLLTNQIGKAGHALSQFPLEWYTRETTLLPFLYGAFLYVTEGKDLAWIHYSGVLETAYPRTWTLGLRYLIDKLPENWLNQAFDWEVKQLANQLQFFSSLTHDEGLLTKLSKLSSSSRLEM